MIETIPPSPALSTVSAFLDACVLYPVILRDTLLRAAEANLFHPLWSTDILAELERNLVADAGATPVSVERMLRAMRQAFPDAAVTDYEHLIGQLRNHPKDRHVLAAAVHTRAHVFVTDILVDFPPAALTPHGVFALSPDDFLQRLFDEAPDRMIQVIIDHAASHRPSISVTDLLDRLSKHVPTLRARILAELS